MLSQDGNNYIVFRTTDRASNVETSVVSDLIQIDKTSPVINLSTSARRNSIDLSVSTNEDSNCRYDTNVLMSFDDMNSLIDTGIITSFTWPTIGGLDAGTNYTYFVQCRNQVGYDNNKTITTQTSGPTYGNHTGGSSGGSTTADYTPGITVISNITQTVSYDANEIREALGDMLDDQNEALYSPTEIKGIVDNSAQYEFSRTVLVEKIVSENGSTSYRVTITTRVENKTKDDLKNVKVIIEVPKSVTSSASNVQSLIPFTVIVNDPVLEFTILSLNSGASADVVYTVTRSTNIDINKIIFSEPLVRTATTVEVPVTKPPVNPPVEKPIEQTVVPQINNTPQTQAATPMNWNPIILAVVLAVLCIGYFVFKAKKKTIFG